MQNFNCFDNFWAVSEIINYDKFHQLIFQEPVKAYINFINLNLI